jgi:geranylgeranyl reductase family protein
VPQRAFDVIVIGAGPAGAWTARRLAEQGVNVALVDGSQPREKPCGGGVTSRALRLVGHAVNAELASVKVRNARFIDSVRHLSADVRLGDADALIVASRREFDGCLLSAARRSGADHLRSRLVSAQRDGNLWRAETADGHTLTSPVLVGADGANSFVRRQVAHPFRRNQLSIATGFFAHGVTSDEIVIEFTSTPPGYMWSFPRPDHLAIGVCAQADVTSADALRAEAARWIERTGIARSARLQRYSWPIPSLPADDFSCLELAGPGWALVGDAAGLVDPITREGIFFALQSAELAAQALTRPDGHREYAERVRADIASELARAARFKARFFRPAFVDLMLGALAESARIRQVMADLIAGTQSYRTLTWRLMGTFELGLAWKALTARSSRPVRERSHQAV